MQGFILNVQCIDTECEKFHHVNVCAHILEFINYKSFHYADEAQFSVLFADVELLVVFHFSFLAFFLSLGRSFCVHSKQQKACLSSSFPLFSLMLLVQLIHSKMSSFSSCSHCCKF